MSQVDQELHNKFCQERRLESYIGSAKTGDQINQIFFKVAADLAGVKVTKAQIEAQQNYNATSEAAANLMQSNQSKKNAEMN